MLLLAAAFVLALALLYAGFGYGWVVLLGIIAYVVFEFLRPPSFKLEKWPSMIKIYLQALGQMAIKPRWIGSSFSKAEDTKASMVTASKVNGAKVAAYRKLMKMEKQDSGTVPLMYFIVEPFCLSMYVLLHGLPLTPVGSVLAKHTSQVFRRVSENEPLKHHCLVDGNVRRTEKDDAELDFINTAQDENGEVVWKSVTTVIFLNPKRIKALKDKKKPQEPGSPIPGELIDTWNLGGDTGRLYGAINGDINPIHLYPWCSKLFGFKRPIAHALYQVGRSVATMENKKGLDVTDGWEVTAEFKRPSMLPCKLKFLSQTEGAPENGHKFCVTTEDGMKEVLIGTLQKIKKN